LTIGKRLWLASSIVHIIENTVSATPWTGVLDCRAGALSWSWYALWRSVVDKIAITVTRVSLKGVIKSVVWNEL
jgi:hypothetical protein